MVAEYFFNIKLPFGYCFMCLNKMYIPKYWLNYNFLFFYLLEMEL